MKNHTPGPWVGWFKHSETATQPPSYGRVVGPPWHDSKEGSGYTNEGDVALMAKAPELLAENIKLREEIARLKQSVLSWLGVARVILSPEAVEGLQDIVDPIEEEAAQ